MLRTGGPVQRRAVIRGVSFALQRRRQSTASLDTWRLATRPLDTATCARCRWTPASKSAVGTIALENFRQSPTQSCPSSIDIVVAARMDRTGSKLVLDLDRPRHSGRSFRRRDLFGPAAEGARGAAAAASRCRNADSGPPLRSGVVHAGVPSLRGLFEPRCNPAHAGPAAVHSSQASRMESVA